MKRIRSLFIWRGLTTQILLFAVMPITLVLILVTFGSVQLHRDAMRSLVGERDTRTVRSAAIALGEQISHRASIVQALALRGQDNPSPEEILSSSSFFTSDFDIGVAFYQPNGERIALQGDADAWSAIEELVEQFVLLCVTAGDADAEFSEAFLHPDSGSYVVLTLAQASPSLPLAVGAFSVDRVALQTLAGSISSSSGPRIFLVDDLGQVLFSQGATSLESPPLEHPGVVEAMEGESGTLYLAQENQEHVVAYNPVLPPGWALVIEEPWESVASPLLRYTEFAPLILIPVLVFAISSLWLSARQVIQPIKQLETQSAQIEWGDYETVRQEVGGIEEVQSLQRTLVHLATRIQRSQQSLRDYIGVITDAQEEERLRLARELHDDTLQTLIALNQRLHLLRRELTNRQALEALDETESMLAETIEGVRRFTRALRPLYLEDFGLVTAVEMLAREYSEQNKIEITFEKTGDALRLSDDHEIALYRIAQEALSNVVRHASASRATVGLHFSPEQIRLSIVDNGRGFDVPESPTDLATDGHFGLLGIFERAQLIGAVCSIESVVSEGTQLEVRLRTSLLDTP